LLELLKPSDPVGHLLRPRDVLAHRPSAKSGAATSSSARHATAAHTSSLSTRLMLGSAAFTLAMSARATSSSAGVGRMARIVAGTPRLSHNSWRNSACGLYIRIIGSAPGQRASKRFKLFWSILKGLYGGLHFSLALLLLLYLRRRSPGPPFPPDHRQAGERGAIILSYHLDIFHLPPHGRKGPLPGCSDDQVARCARNHPACFEQPAAT
jgi:hypothetical protein